MVGRLEKFSWENLRFCNWIYCFSVLLNVGLLIVIGFFFNCFSVDICWFFGMIRSFIIWVVCYLFGSVVSFFYSCWFVFLWILLMRCISVVVLGSNILFWSNYVVVKLNIRFGCLLLSYVWVYSRCFRWKDYGKLLNLW